VEDDCAKTDDFIFNGILSTSRNDVGNDSFGILQHCWLFEAL
jgi:hypothetical protein